MRAYMKINLENLKTNFENIKHASQKDIIAVIKSNAYGHGLIPIAVTLSKLNVKMLAVATMEEALQIRKSLIFLPILLLETTTDYCRANNYKITLSINSITQLKELQKSPLPVFVHLQIDTGLGRDGILLTEIEEAKKILSESRLVLKGIFTHYQWLNTFNEQTELFREALKHFSKKNYIIHSQASFTSNFDIEETNAMRIGYFLYGEGPRSEQILELFAPVVHKKKVQKGDLVAYDQSGIIPEDGYVYTIPFGYADGWKRSHKLTGYLDNEYLPQIGNCFMDYMLLFSTTDFPIGKEVEIIGKHLSLDFLAGHYNTIPYELMAGLSPRLKRIYI